MGKNHRHSKKLKSERNKVHIKSKTKFLPKGQNVTNTSFKIKPIVIQEQLKNKEAVTFSIKKKINVDESVSKLRHFNETVKVEACQDLKDFITQDSETTQKYLSSILQNASALIQDRERRVRRASIKLINAVFEKESDTVMRSFFNYILMNLKCAMTNINKHIQEDSLLLLDAILEHKSSLLAENFDNIFPNFLMLISKFKNHSTVERSLSLNLEGKITSVKWRVKVLTRLYGILNAINQSAGTNKDNGNIVADGAKTVVAKETCFIPIYKNISIYENPECPLLFSSKNNHCSVLDTQIYNFVQLLHEIWMEVVPEKTSKKKVPEPTVLTTEESVAVFSCVVNILRLLQEHLNLSGREEFFQQNKAALLFDHLISNFPYTHNRRNLSEISKEFSKSFTLNNDQNCVQENLIIIHLFITLRIKNTKNIPNRSIGSYLNNCLKSHRQSGNSALYLTKMLREILLNQPNLLRRLGTNPAEITENLATFYSNAKIPDGTKSDILDLLTRLKLENLKPWLEELPNILCGGQVSAKLIEAVLDLCRKGEESVQYGIKNALKSILENLPKLEITETKEPETAYMNLASIFFYLPVLKKEDVEEINRFVELNPSLSSSNYLKNIMELRSSMVK